MTDNLKSQLKSILERHEGRSRAITSRELAAITQQAERRVRLVIRELISDGLPVLSATEQPAGYFLASSHKEIKEYAAVLRGRLIGDALRRRDVITAGTRYLAPAEQGRLV